MHPQEGLKPIIIIIEVRGFYVKRNSSIHIHKLKFMNTFIFFLGLFGQRPERLSKT